MTVAAETVAHTPDIGVTRDEAIVSSKLSLDFFAALCLPEIFKFCYPPLLKAVWQMLCSYAQETHGKKRVALGIPRGFSKTLLMKLFVCWCIVFTNRRFILVVCNTATLAENFIADVADVLSSLNFLRVFGDWRITIEKDTQEIKKFYFRGRSITLAGLGAGSSLRGLNIKYVRPDIILMDDMQSREQAASSVEATKNLTWMLGTLMKAADTGRCLYIFIGNMYPYEGSILKKLKTNPAWISFITGAILEDGQSLWPELRSVEDILNELDNDESMGHPEIFYSEVMNDEVAGSRSGVDFSKINTWDDTMPDDSLAQAGFVIIDPALAKRKSDDCAIGAVLIFEGEPVLREVVSGKLNEMQKIDTMIKLAAKYGLRCLVVEAVAYQGSLCFWIERRKQQLGLTDLQVLEIHPGQDHKNARIIEALKQLTASKERIWVHRSARSQVTHQITYWEPLRQTNVDDILDLLAYMRRVMNKFGHRLIRPLDMIIEEVEASFSADLQLGF